MRRNLRKTIPILLIVTMLLCSMSIAFAGNEQIDVTDKSVEVEFYKEDVLNGTNNEVRIVEYEDGTLEVIDNDTLIIQDADAAYSAVITASITEWYTGANSGYVEVRIKSEANELTKSATGKLEVHRNSLLNAKLLSGFDYAMTNKAGAKTLTAYYDAWVGASESSVKLKLSNIINQDIYAELHSGVAVWSAAFNRP